MYDRCVAGDRLRTVMSSIMRRRRGLISAIGVLLSARVGFDNPQSFRQERSHANTAIPIPRQRFSSIPFRFLFHARCSSPIGMAAAILTVLWSVLALFHA